MELLSPAGSLEKLSYAYKYGADASYIGVQDFSLRSKAQNIDFNDLKSLREIKADKRLYGALNTFFHENKIEKLKENLPLLNEYPFDAFIVSDLGAANLLTDYFGSSRKYHLSTQANTLNGEAVKVYKQLGFSRIILGREVSLNEIKRIKDAVPEMEIEVFVHGSMCMAYSGRCFISAFMSERSANEGDCSHSCRWKYSLNEKNIEYALEEESRKGEYFPVFEEDDFTTILSSKDLCMIDYLDDLKNAGVDSIKIEGRMKSLYYVATVTRAYRKALDKDLQLNDYREELFNVSHREFSTGFFFDNEQISEAIKTDYLRSYLLIGTVGEKIESNLYRLNLKNKIEEDVEVEYIGPQVLSISDNSFKLYDENNNRLNWANHHQQVFLQTNKEIEPDYIIRRKL